MQSTVKDAANNQPPAYGTKPKKPGLYLGLFHGRHKPDEEMNDWGFNGPTIGPLRWCHTTYLCEIKIEFEEKEDAVAYFGVEQEQFELTINGDLLMFNHKYYDDWTLYVVGPEDCERPPDTFRSTNRTNNLIAHRKYLI